ncbi:MAG TPA: hypothetical protein VMI31_16990 [Fimbriimonadaceae bacterium]|nr:hypothetical protein [Fimbriimonadaceae bacterium]
MRCLPILVLVGVLVIAGCGGLKSKIVGKWKIDTASVKSPLLDHAKQELGADKVNQSLDAGRFDFKEDGTLAIASSMGVTA